MSNETKRIVIEVDDTLKQRFKEKVESEGGTMKYFITRWIKDYTYDRKEIK